MGIAAAEFQFHVLAVDDSLIDRKLIERLLKTSSYQVTTVDSGSKALEFLGLNEEDSNQVPFFPDNHHEMDVNLVITDYCMPGMTGYDLLKKIKESSSLRNIPVVIMSSENVPSRIDRCFEEGADEFFLKPVRLSDVNKLRPHLMKTKCNEMPEKQENQAFTKVSSQDKFQVLKFKQQRSQQKQSQTQAIGTKRKAVNEGVFLPERTRTRTIFNGLPAVSNLSVIPFSSANLYDFI